MSKYLEKYQTNIQRWNLLQGEGRNHQAMVKLAERDTTQITIRKYIFSKRGAHKIQLDKVALI